MSNDELENVFEELKTLRDVVKLKVHLAGMDIREQWDALEEEWNGWQHQLAQEFKVGSEDLEAKLRDAGGDELRKAEIATKVTISKLKRGLQEIGSKLSDEN